VRVLTAEVHLLPASEGGRTSAIRSGYRGICRIGTSPIFIGFELELDAVSLAPGEKGVGQLSFWAEDQLPDVPTGTSLEIREGRNIVGIGEILA